MEFLNKNNKPKYRPTKIYDRHNNQNVDIGLARHIKKWKKEDFYTYYHDAHELDTGRIIVFTEKIFY